MDKKEDLTVKFMSAWKSNIMLDIGKINFEKLKEEFQKIKDGNHESYKDDPSSKKDAINSLSKKKFLFFLEIINELVKVQFEILDSEILIEEEKKKKRKIKSVFVTFKNRAQRKAFSRLLPKSILQNKLQCVKKFKIKENSIFVRDPPDPININWRNFNLNLKNKLTRRCISWIIFILIFFIRKIKFS